MAFSGPLYLNLGHVQVCGSSVSFDQYLQFLHLGIRLVLNSKRKMGDGANTNVHPACKFDASL